MCSCLKKIFVNGSRARNFTEAARFRVKSETNNNMAASSTDGDGFWHTNLKVFPHLQADLVEKFVSEN